MKFFASVCVITVLVCCVFGTDPKALIARTLGTNTAEKEQIPSDIIHEITKEWVQWPSVQSNMNELIEGTFEHLFDAMWRMRCNQLIQEKLRRCNDHRYAVKFGGETSMTFAPSGNLYRFNFEAVSESAKLTASVIDNKDQVQQTVSVGFPNCASADLMVTNQQAIIKGPSGTMKTNKGGFLVEKVIISWEDVVVRDIQMIARNVPRWGDRPVDFFGK